MNMKFNIEGNEVEITTKTGNNMKYMFVINNKRAYLKTKPVKGADKDADEAYDACEFLVRKYYNNGVFCSKQEFLNKIIMFFEGAFDSEETVETHEMCETPYVASPIPEGFDAEVEDDDDDDDDVEGIVKVVTARGTVINFCKTMFANYSARVSNFNFKPVSFDYYSEFEVESKFYNMTDIPQLM